MRNPKYHVVTIDKRYGLVNGPASYLDESMGIARNKALIVEKDCSGGR